MNAARDATLSVRVRKGFVREAGGFLLDADLSLPSGITILFGPSGSGKTTLLACVAGLLPPDAGRIAADDRLYFDSDRGVDVAVARRSIGYVFQNLALFPHLTAEENIQYGLGGLPRAERVRRSRAMAESFRIPHLLARYPREISGGERQRVALARALVIEPRVLLLDEPLSGLDASTKAKIIEDLRSWNAAHGIPIVYVTHARDEVFALGERVVVLTDGKVLAQGTPQEVLEAPRHETIAQLAGFENIFDAMVTALHQAHGTMTCRLQGSEVDLEVPLARMEAGARARVAVRAGDILLATRPPSHLSARNVLAGTLASLQQRGVTVVAQVDCGVGMEVHLTPGACEALQLRAGLQVWLVVKTHSCHLAG
ncbi:MAG TPA: molybdenum ABC transporter ATP-binding protein [Terriglobales bacterium]|jgi:molybdate transport system ATP-binding protein|nr:molybdenum ABC transporter ATP-binding protein [Terriglobales bacterium]